MSQHTYTEDAVSIDLLVKKLEEEDYNPILLYKPQGVADPTLSNVPQDQFKLALQTEFQRDTYQQ